MDTEVGNLKIVDMFHTLEHMCLFGEQMTKVWKETTTGGKSLYSSIEIL